MLAQFKVAHPEFNIVALIRPDGQLLATSERSGPEGLPSLAKDSSFQESLARLQNGETMVISRPFRGPMTNGWITPLRHAVRDPAGRLLYVVGAGLPLSSTLSFWKDAPIPAHTTLSLIRDDGYLVARYPVPERQSEDDTYLKPMLGALTGHLAHNKYPHLGQLDGTGSVSGDAGGSVLVFRRLANYPLTFYFRNPKTNLLHAWWDDVWFDYLLMALMCAGAAGIYYWVQARQARWNEERSRRIEQLETANQELASFTYAISHDLRGPLRAIDGFAALQMEELADLKPPADARHLARIRDNTLRMTRLIDGLLDFSRQSQVALDIRRVDITALVRSVLREEIPADAAIEVRVGPLPDRHGDPALLRKLWRNLIANAVKYTGNTPAPRIEIGYADGAYFVRDNGAGFDMAHAAKLFGVFSRLHHITEFDGTGVGLAIVRRIVERHGGRIWATSEPNRGAEFRFALVDQAI
jgi:signal transduction histidine kinase